jgi:hypothetical protein
MEFPCWREEMSSPRGPDESQQRARLTRGGDNIFRLLGHTESIPLDVVDAGNTKGLVEPSYIRTVSFVVLVIL